MDREQRVVQLLAFRVDVLQEAEAAERLGVRHVETVHAWRRRYPEFPPPVAKLKQAMVWAWPDVEGWAKATGRL